MKKKWPWIVLGLIILLVALARFSLTTSLVHEYVRSQIIRSASSFLNAKLHIEEVEGDLWKEIKLRQISITRPDTVLKIDTLYLGYNLPSYFSSVFRVSEVRISNPQLTIRQNEQGEYNITQLMKEDPAAADRTPLFFHVDRVDVREGSMRAGLNNIAGDTLLSIDAFSLQGSIGYFESGYDLKLNTLSFEIMDTRLRDPVDVQAAGRASDKKITLDQLVVASGRSFLTTSGLIGLADSSARIEVSGQPISWKDLSSYADSYPVRENLQIEAGLKGDLQDFEVSISADSKSLAHASLTGRFTWDKKLLLKEAKFSADRIDAAELLSNADYPQLTDFELQAEGEMDFSSYRTSSLSGSIAVRNVRGSRYRLGEADGTFNLEGSNLKVNISTRTGDQDLDAKFSARDIWNDNPGVKLELDGRNINPAIWSNNTLFDGEINGTLRLEGSGYKEEHRNLEYSIEIADSRIEKQPFSRIRMGGKLKEDRVSMNGIIRFEESTITVDAEVSDYLIRPEYSYEIKSKEFNLAECHGLEDFNTSITVVIKGKGMYTRPETLELFSTVRMDSSIINGEVVQELTADVQVKDTVANVTEAHLISDIADGSFTARMHLLHWFDNSNRLDLDMNVKETRALAPLLEVENVQAKGHVKGSLSPIYEDNLKFSGEISFDNVTFGEAFASQKVEGSVEALVVEEPEFVLNLDLQNPMYKAFELQDAQLTTRGKVTSDSTFGDFQLMFSSPKGNRIQQFGSYSVDEQRARVHTIDLQIISSIRTLNLRKPFDLILAPSSLQLDTVHVEAEDGAYLEMAIPYADSLNQRGYLQGHKLNVTLIQNTLLNDSFFEGIVSGHMYVDRRHHELSATGNLKIEQVYFRGAEVDSISLNYVLENKRLEGGLNIFNDNAQQVKGQLRIPFRLGDPDQFEKAFFEEPVTGFLRVNPVSLEQFQKMMEEAGITGTKGLVKLEANLSGTAGNPDLNARLNIQKPVLSGVPLDSINVSANYIHGNRELDLNASVISLGQKAAEVQSRIPLNVDLRKIRVDLPEPEDSIRVDITTNKFNLASLNDFVNRNNFRDISGNLNGHVLVDGTVENLQTSGRLSLSGGSVRIVASGTRIQDIRTILEFENSTVLLEQLSASSGGKLTAEGKIGLNRLFPEEMDIDMRARNFTVANTSDYRAIVDLDAELAGTLTKPRVKGRINFKTGYIYIQNFGERSVETIKLDSTAATGYDEYTVYDSLSLDVDIEFNRRFFVRNRRFLDLEYEMEGQLDLLKEPEKEIQLFGTLNAVKGYARPLGKQFALEQGEIGFAGDPTNPSLNIRHLFEPPQPQNDIRIWYVIEGTVEKPQFKYESSPPMELQNIISYTLFGQPFYALDSWKQVVAKSGSNAGTADLAVDILLDKVEMLATQKLGIDVVQIDNTRSSADSGPTITTGWYINPKVFFAIQNEITGPSPETFFKLEYFLKKNLKIIINQGGDTRQGVDLNWNHEY